MLIYWNLNGFRCDSAGANIYNNAAPALYYGE